MRQFSVEEIERALLAKRDAEKAAIFKNHIGTKLDVLGVERKELLEILHALQPLLPAAEEEFVWLNLLQDLWESDYFEARLIALELMFATEDLVDAHLWGMLDHWTNSLDNWVLADWLGHVRAVALAKAPGLVKRMAPWLRSRDVWRRRSTLVSLVHLNPQTFEERVLLETDDAFVFLEPVLNDAEISVQQGLAWFLKRLRDKNPAAFEALLTKAHKQIAPGVIQSLAKNETAHTGAYA